MCRSANIFQMSSLYHNVCLSSLPAPFGHIDCFQGAKLHYFNIIWAHDVTECQSCADFFDNCQSGHWEHRKNTKGAGVRQFNRHSLATSH